MRRALGLALVGVLASGFWRIVSAQCPDGTPPPCARTARVAPPPAAERARRFVVLPFRNLSRSPELDWLVDGSAALLTDALARWQDLTVVPEERLAPALRRAGFSAGSVPGIALLRRLADMTGGWTAVTGEMMLTSGRVVVRARALDAATGREVGRADVEMPATEDVRPAFTRVGLQLLRATGRSNGQGDTAVTTASLDSYRAYVRGLGLFDHLRYNEAAGAFRESIAHDSSFAQAWAALSTVLLLRGPLALFEAGSELRQTIAHSVALADRLPPRQRDMILARGALLSGQMGSAREALERRLATDSSDVEAASWLAFTEWVDPVAVTSPQGPRRRGSLERSLRLSRSILAREPDGHGSYIPIVYTYLMAAGDLPAVQLGFPRDLPIEQMLTTTPSGVFVPVLFDTLASVPVGGFFALPPDSVAAAHARALEAARLWSERWLAAGPAEGAAHQAAARVSELAGDYPTALAQLRAADSLHVDLGYLNPRFQRLAVLGKSGNYDAAFALADSLLRTGRLDHVMGIPNDDLDALRWAFNLMVMRGEFARADSLIDRLTGSMSFALGSNAPGARSVGFALLAGRVVRPLWIVPTPLAARLAALDSAWTRLAQQPASARWPAFAQLAQWAAQDAAGDSTLSAHLATAPWRQ